MVNTLKSSQCVHCILEAYPPGAGPVSAIDERWIRIFMPGGETLVIDRRLVYEPGSPCTYHTGLDLVGAHVVPNNGFDFRDVETGRDLSDFRSCDFMEDVHPWFRVLLEITTDRLDGPHRGGDTVVINFGRPGVPCGVYLCSHGMTASCITTGPPVQGMPETFSFTINPFGGWFSWLVLKPAGTGSRKPFANDLTRYLIRTSGFSTAGIDRFEARSPIILYGGGRWVLECVPHLHPTLTVAKESIECALDPGSIVVIWPGPALPVVRHVLETVLVDRVRDLAGTLAANFEDIFVHRVDDRRVTHRWVEIPKNAPRKKLSFTVTGHRPEVLAAMYDGGWRLGHTMPGMGFDTDLKVEPAPGVKLDGPPRQLHPEFLRAAMAKIEPLVAPIESELRGNTSLHAWTIAVVALVGRFGILITALESRS
ncbi:ORF75 [Ictalurid herpesvirus 1]|nr:ORF75 [Ictalurid herpesvirus 1]